MKDSAQRITDTIEFIKTAVVPNNGHVRMVVATILTERYNTNRISDVISPAMSQGDNFTVFGRTQVQLHRSYRRAIILIRSALMGLDRVVAHGQAAQIADLALPAALAGDLGSIAATIQDLTARLISLRNNPSGFLANNRVVIAGGGGQSQVMDYGIYFDTGNNKYNFRPERGIVNWVSLKISVYHLHVIQYNTLNIVNNRIVIPASDVDGANLMFTTQLTGCSVAYYFNGNNLIAAHVQPPGGMGAGENACTNLRATGIFSTNHTPDGVFGPQLNKNNNTDNYIKAGNHNYCVGVRINGTWQLHAQESPTNGGNLSTWQIA